MPQFTQGFRLDLANSLARHGELAPNLFKRVIGIHINTESHSEHLCLTLGQRSQHIVGRLTQSFIRCLIKRRLNRSVADQIPNRRVIVVSHRSFERYWLFRSVERLDDLILRKFHLFTELFDGGRTAKLLQ